MASINFSTNNLNPNAEPFVPPKYYLVMNPQLDQGHFTPAYYYPLPNWMVPQSAQQVVYPSPLQPFYQQMVQYQAPSLPQYYIPEQQINQSYSYNPYVYNANGYEYDNSMNGDQSGNEYYNRGYNGRGNSRGHHCDHHNCNHQRHVKNHRNYSNGNWHNGNGNRNRYNQPQSSYNVQYVDNYNNNHSNGGYYHQDQEHNKFNETHPLAEYFGDIDVEEIEASVSD